LIIETNSSDHQTNENASEQTKMPTLRSVSLCPMTFFLSAIVKISKIYESSILVLKRVLFFKSKKILKIKKSKDIYLQI